MPYRLDGSTGSLEDSKPMPLAVPRQWQGVDQRRLVTGTHGVKCDTSVKTSLVCAQSLNGSEESLCSVCETVKGMRNEVAIGGID